LSQAITKFEDGALRAPFFYFEANSSAQSAPVFRKTQRGEILAG
jgi:hypothetical protein